MMKLVELKQQVWKSWQHFNEASGVISQPAAYVQDVKRFGDRRCKHTWVKALAHFSARASYESCLDASMLILHSFNFTPDRWDYEYRHEILDEFLMYPDGLEAIREGLEQLFSSDFTAGERDDAHGFFELVEERGGQSRGECLTIGFDRGRTTASAPAPAR